MNNAEVRTKEEAREELLRQQEYYETYLRERLEKESFGKWAVISNDELVAICESDSKAAELALKRHPAQVSMVRRIGYEYVAHPVLGLKYVPVRHS